MSLKNTQDAFGFVAKTFHWVMAVLIFGMLAVGFRLEQLEGTDRLALMYAHKSFGILILFMIAARLLWRIVSPRPPRLPSVKPWEDRLATVVQFLLYGVVFALPLSGWIMSAAGEYPVRFFGLFNLPPIVPKNEDIMDAAKEAHEIMAFALLGLLFLHLSGAAKHHVIDRDDTLRRMAWRRMSYIGGIILIVLGGAMYMTPIAIGLMEEEEEEAPVVRVSEVAAPAEAAPQDETAWVVDRNASSIRFISEQSGNPFGGEFRNFDANIVFDEKNLAGNHVEVKIPLSGFTTGSSERDTEAVKADWFNAATFPEASFVSSKFQQTGANQYVAHGTLTIRGVAKPIDLPFELNHVIAKLEYTEMKARIELNRLDYGIGQGTWQKTDVIADKVKVDIYVKASQS